MPVGVKLPECRFANDLVIFAKSERVLKERQDILNEKLSERKVKINEEKWSAGKEAL